MGRMYRAQVSAVAVTAAQDIFEIVAPSDVLVIVHGWEVFQTSDVGDAAEELLRLQTTRGVGATSGSGGSSPTVQPIDNGDAAVSATVEANNTTQMTAGGGSLEVLEQYGWNVRMPREKLYAPEERPIITPGERWTLALPAAPADSLTLTAMVTFEEIG